MKPTTVDIECKGYSVKADIYEGRQNNPVLLSLIGRTSRRTKQRYYDFLPRLANELGITSVIFDYTGHGDSPFDIEELSAAQHFLEVITVFDWMKQKYPDRKFFVIGSSYGGFLATQLTKYRKFDGLILRAPAIYHPQDFYTLMKNEDREATQVFRKNVEALAKHPLLARASQFKGDVLLVVHKRDEQIPKETTDAYANAFHPDLILEDVKHSLDQATEKQVDEYNQKIIDWLAAQIKEER
jgi:alpha-beta hydrolase superfamily lysophospholipase